MVFWRKPYLDWGIWLSDLVSDVQEEQRTGQQMLHQLDQDQRHIVNTFLNALNAHTDNRCFFVDGSGGTGKTFLYNTLVHILRGMEIKVKCIAYSGIASTLLIDCSTAHSTFQMAISLTQNATCNVSRQRYRVQDLTCILLYSYGMRPQWSSNGSNKSGYVTQRSYTY